MNRSTDITKIEFYLQNMKRSASGMSTAQKAHTRQKNFKILVRDDIRDSIYLIDA